MRTRALILKKQATNEWDQLVTCYTEEFGKLTAIAKSILKSTSIQAMHLDVFNLVDFELINGRGMPIITGAQAENSYSGLKSSLSSIALTCFFVEVIDKIAFDYQKDETLWDFLVLLLNNLNREECRTQRDSLHGFFREKQANLLKILGYQPNWADCSFCAKKIVEEKLIFSPETSGLMCQNCFMEGRIGIIMKKEDFLSGQYLDDVFESLAEKKIHSLNFIKNVLV